MSDLIKRADAIKTVHKYFVKEIDKTPHEIDEDGYDVYTDMPTVNSLFTCNKELSKALKALPSAEAVQGEWVECIAYNPDLDEDVLYIECDQCGHRPYFSGSYRPKYCEECGSIMKGADDE